MDIKELKKLIKSSTSVLVLDDGQPSFVLLGYDMYKDLVSGKNIEKEVKITQSSNNSRTNIMNEVSQNHERESEILERLNKDILALKNQIEMEERGISGGVDSDID